MAQQAGGNGGGREAGAYLSDYSQTFARGLAQLQAMGILLKDLERGLIDFPHQRDGREVYLCGSMAKSASTTGMRPIRLLRTSIPLGSVH